ncbi:DUF4282 domain-containing protein [Corynebacterium urogenitale]
MTDPHTPFAGQPAFQPQNAESQADDGFFSALMDLSLTKYITLRLVRVLFILGLIGVAVQWVFSLFAIFALPEMVNDFATDLENNLSSSGTSSAVEVVAFSALQKIILVVLVTIASLANVVLLRVVLEGIQALTRTARSWRRIQERIDRGVVTF